MSNKSFTGKNIRLPNRQSYGNDIEAQLIGGQGASDVSSNTSSAYKMAKPTGKSESKKVLIHFRFGNQDVTLETPNIWMSEEKFQQMQREKEYAMKFSRPLNAGKQDYLKNGDANSGINTSKTAMFDLRKIESTVMRTNHSIDEAMPEQYVAENLAKGNNIDDNLQEIPKIGYDAAPWWNKGDLGTGELVVMPEFFKTVGDVVQYYGGWAGIEKEIPREMRAGFIAAYTFLSTWGLEYAKFLVSKAPMPPNVKLVIEVAGFMFMVCEVAGKVQTKRKDMIDSLTTGENPICSSETEAKAEADKNTYKWLLEAIEEVAIGTVVGTVLDRLPWETYSKKYLNEYTKEAVTATIKALWDAFVNVAKAGVWVRGVAHQSNTVSQDDALFY